MSLKFTNLTPAETSLGIVESGVLNGGSRWLDAWGDVSKVVFSNLTGTGVLTSTVTGSTPTIVPSLTPGELYTITTPATDFSGVNSQVTGEPFKLELGKPLKLYGQFKLGEATQSDFLFGLCGIKTDLMAVSEAHGITASAVEGIFFCKIDNTTTINCHAYLAGAQTNVAVAGVMDTLAHEYEIQWDGSVCRFYFDEVLVASFTTSLPTADLTLSFNVRAGSAAANTFTIYNGLCAIQARS